VRRIVEFGAAILLANLTFLAFPPSSEATPTQDDLFLLEVSMPCDYGNLLEERPPFRLEETGSSTVYVTTKPNNQKGILYMVNVTAFFESSRIATSISNSSGVAAFSDVPYGNVTFIAYAKSDYSQEIGNLTKHISSESESFNLICDQNYAETSQDWEIRIVASSLSKLINVSTLLVASPQHELRNETGNQNPQPLKGG